MANQVHGPLGMLLVRLAQADSTDRRRESKTPEPRALADQAADYLEWLLRNQAEAAGGMENLPNVPRA